MLDLINFIVKLIKHVSGTDNIQLAYYKQILEAPFKFLLYGNTVATYTGSESSLNAILVNIYDSIFPLAAILIVIAFMGKVVDFASTDQFNYEVLLKHIIYVIVLLLILGNGVHWIGVLYEYVDGIASDVYSKVSVETLNSNSGIMSLLGITNAKGEFNPWEVLKKAVFPETAVLTIMYYLLGALVSFILGIITTAVLTYAAIIRATKLGIYVVLMPFAVSDLYSSGTTSKLIPYAKKLIALLLQEYVILFDVAILTTLSTSGVFSQLLVFFITLSCITGSENASKRLVGAL